MSIVGEIRHIFVVPFFTGKSFFFGRERALELQLFSKKKHNVKELSLTEDMKIDSKQLLLYWKHTLFGSVFVLQHWLDLLNVFREVVNFAFEEILGLLFSLEVK